MSLIDTSSMWGHYDREGNWQRTKFCHVDCGTRCDCKPPGGRWYSKAHDQRLQQPSKSDAEVPR